MSLTDTRNSHNSIAKKKNPINLIKISQRTWIEFLWRGNTKVQKKVFNITNHLCVCVCTHNQSSLTLRNLMDCSPPGSSVHGIFQARILEWIAFSFCRGSSWLRDRTHVSCISCTAGRFFTTAPPGKPEELIQLHIKNDFRMDRRPGETFLQRKHSDG